MPKKLSTPEIIRRVTAIRRRNNVLWMKILQIALEADPKAKKIVKEIVTNDKWVSQWMSRV